MGARELLTKKLNFGGKSIRFKDAIRNGFVHQYLMKVGSSCVAMDSSKAEAQRTGFLIKEPDEVVRVVIPYFTLFTQAQLRANEQGRLAWKT